MAKPRPKAPGGPVFFRRRDLAVIAILLLAAAVWLLAAWPAAQGAFATVTVGYDERQTVRELSLSAGGVVHIDAALPVTLEIKDGAIRFISSVCPDHTCERFGWLSREGDRAVCMPAGVTVLVTEAPDGR